MADYTGPTDRLQFYEDAVSLVEGLERKGATMPYTSRNGHMTSFLDKEGTVAVRLDPESRKEFLGTYESTTAVQYGRKMKEFVVIPDSLLDDPEALAAWLERSSEWVGTLKPK